MKQRIVEMAKVSTAAALLGCVAYALPLRHPRPVAASHGQVPVHTVARKALYNSQASAILHGVIAPLNSLRLMKRAIAATPNPKVRDIPLLAILNEPLKTTGLGPLKIGMTIAEANTVGLELVPIAGSHRGECQYYRIQGNSEPISLMAIDNRILRIDVGLGGLTETLSGAKIGSTEADLVRLYGNQLEATPNPITLGKTIIFKPKDPGADLYRLVFETDDQGRVVRFRAGQFPSVAWPEGCL